MQQLKKKQLNAYAQSVKKQQDELVVQFLPAVRAMGYRLKERLPSSVDVNDLISIGTEELIKLSRKYDKEQNDSFWGYGKKRVYGSMLDFLRSLDVISRANRRLLKAVDYEIDKYYNENEEEPDDEYLAEILNEDIEKINEVKNISSIITLMPITEQMDLYEPEETLAIVEKDELIEIITNIIENFNKREKLIIQLYYFEELSLKEISEILEISESRISQIHKKLIRKIREELRCDNG